MANSKHTGFFPSWFASGEPWIWMNAAAVGISVSAVIGILLLIAVKGLAHFWPSDVAMISFTDKNGLPQTVYGELIELDQLPVKQFLESGGDPSLTKAGESRMQRWLVKTGNRKVNPPDFRWIYLNQISDIQNPEDVIVLERVEWGNAYGVPTSLRVGNTDGNLITGAQLPSALQQRLQRGELIREEIHKLEQGEMNSINRELEKLRLQMRQLTQAQAVDESALAEAQALQTGLLSRYNTLEKQLRRQYQELDQDQLIITDAAGQAIDLRLADVLRIWQPNAMNSLEKILKYFGNLWLFLSEDPREANTEGGVFPAIFGTVLMVLLMSIVVTPFGVIAAVYLREYAKQGPLVRAIRIAVNNLAGVPSIVYGVFGLGFFVYFLGGNIDQLFFTEADRKSVV